MNQAPNTDELSTSHIPALATLMALGWDYMNAAKCAELRDGNSNVVIKSLLIRALQAKRFDYRGKTYPLSGNSIEQIVRDLTAPSMGAGLLEANEIIYNQLTLGITVTEFINGKKHSPTIKIIDWDNPDNNSYTFTEEFEVLNTAGTNTRRPDIVCFVNGLPLVVIEAKRAASGNPNKSMIAEGISQSIRNQRQDEIPLLFAYSQLLMSINGSVGRYGTTKTSGKFWSNWQEEEISETEFSRVKNLELTADQKSELLYTRPKFISDFCHKLWAVKQTVTDQDRLVISLLSKDRLLEFIRYFILFDRKNGKIAARYQQVFGTKNLIAQITQKNLDGSRMGGVIWHTTGSGKSFTMVFLCKAMLIHPDLAQCRIIAVTDRLDLEKQLAKTFLSGGAFGTAKFGRKDISSKYKASTGKDLAHRISSGNERIIFSIINKFGTAAKLPECHNPSADIIVLVDEGHRSQGGENHQRMKKALPNAAFIAFTGTPLLKDDKTTNKFGPIVHAYTMQRAVDDKTVAPLVYEERKPVLDINEKAIDNWFEKITVGLSDKQKSDLKAKYGKKGQIYKSASRVELIAWDIAIHFDENFKKLETGLKGQLACEDRKTAVRYKEALDATGLVSSAIIMSSPDTREGHDDVDASKIPEVQKWWKQNVTVDPEEYERQVLEDFSEPGKPDILIVVSKLLTGFDEPRNGVLYIDKKMESHNLIQAIARVNRLHEAKKYGLLIDYRGILKELDTAITDYQDLAERTQGGFDLDDIKGLYSDVSTEYKKLPDLHNKLWSIFSDVKNKLDREQFRQILIPKYTDAEDGVSIDVSQKVREDFYQALSEFGLCLRIALGSQSFFEDSGVSEKQIATYKKDLKFFTELRSEAKRDAQETVDFNLYEDQIRRLVDKHVVGEEVREPQGAFLVNKLGKKDASEWSEDKLRNETDIIKSRLKKTIEQELGDDPYAQKHFSELLKDAIEEAAAMFEHPFKQYALFEDLAEKIASREVDEIPDALKGSPHQAAYFGILKLNAKNDTRDFDADGNVSVALKIDEVVSNAVAEHSLNPKIIETEIRKGLLPVLFKKIGLDSAKDVIEEIIRVTRIGLS